MFWKARKELKFPMFKSNTLIAIASQVLENCHLIRAVVPTETGPFNFFFLVEQFYNNNSFIIIWENSKDTVGSLTTLILFCQRRMPLKDLREYCVGRNVIMSIGAYHIFVV